MKLRKSLIFSCFIFTFVSCKVENELSELNSKKELTVQEAKKTARILSQQSEVRRKTKSSSAKSGRAVLETDIPIYDFDWDNQYFNNKVPGFPVIMIPLKNNYVNRSVFPDMNPRGYRIVAFQHSPNYETTACIIEFHPDTAYLNRNAALKNYKLQGEEFEDYKNIVSSQDACGYGFVWDTWGNLKGAFYGKNGLFERIYDHNMKLTHSNSR